MNFKNRKTIRLKEYDYTTPGYYFVTICTHKRKRLFQIEDNTVGNDLCVVPCVANRIIHKWLEETENKFGIKIDKYVIMPDHIHLILIITERHTGRSLQSAMGWFKRFLRFSVGLTGFIV